MRFAFYTLGCKTNQYETQAMEQLLTELGHEIGQFDQPCDGYIINTCSVTAVADKKNRAVIRRCRRDNPDAVIGVCGCYSQHAPEAVRALGVDIIGGSGGRREFVKLMLSAMEGKTRAEQLDNALRRREFEVLPAGGLEERTRAMLKVQDGCVNFCSYCIIPYTRGPIRSAPVDVAVSQAQELARRGYREIVVTGIEIASWGADLPGKPEVTELIEAVWLFGLPPEKIQIVVQRQSIVHSAVQYSDNSIIAQLGVPDMRIPIGLAMTYPNRAHNPAPALDLLSCGPLTFDAIDETAFPCFALAQQAAQTGGTACTAMNAANEEAVGLFLQDKIGFYDIADAVEAALRLPVVQEPSLADIFEADRLARIHTRERFLK